MFLLVMVSSLSTSSLRFLWTMVLGPLSGNLSSSACSYMKMLKETAYFLGLQLDGHELGLHEFDLDLLLLSLFFLQGLEEHSTSSLGGSDVRRGRSKICLSGSLGHHPQSLASDGATALSSQGKPIVVVVPLSDRSGILEKRGRKRILLGCILKAIVNL